MIKPEHERQAAQALRETAELHDEICLMKVRNEEDLLFSSSVLRDIATKRRALEGQLKKITAPIRKAEQAARDLFRPALDDLSQAEQVLRKQIAAYHDALRAERAKALAEASAKAQSEPEKAAALVVQASAPTPAAPGVRTRKVWRWKVTDPSLVPNEYMVLDEVAIDAIVKVKKDKTEITGIEVWCETALSVEKRR